MLSPKGHQPKARDDGHGGVGSRTPPMQSSDRRKDMLRLETPNHLLLQLMGKDVQQDLRVRPRVQVPTSAVSELFLVPPHASTLEPLFDALSRTAELNPDSDDESDGDSDGGMLGIAGEDDEPDAEAMLRRFDAMLADSAPPQALPGFARVAGQFGDAADDDGGGFDDL